MTFRVPGNGCVVVWFNSAFVHTCRSKGRPLRGFAWCPSFGHSLNFLCLTLKASLTAAGKVDFLSALKIYHHGSALEFLHLLLTFPCDMCQSCCWTLSEVVCVWCGGLSRCLNHDLFAFPPYVSSFSLFFLLSVCVCFCVSDECQTRLVNHWFM